MEMPKELPENAEETQKEASRAITAACCVLVGVTVVLRYLGRWVLGQRVAAGKGRTTEVFGMDDLFNVLAVLTFFALAAAVFITIDRGMGTHIQVVLFRNGIEGLSDYSFAVYLCAIFYNTTLGMIKLSVLSLYQRILRGVQSQTLPTIVWVVFGIVACNTIANVLVAIFQCSPVKAAWDLTILAEDKKCVNVNAFYLGNAITGVTTDAIVYFLSVPIVKPLQMDLKTKIQLLATMLIGGFAVVTSAVRLGFIPALFNNPDGTYAMAVPMLWSVAEPAVGILVSSMPAIRAVRFLWRRSGENSYGSNAVISTLNSRSGHIQLHERRKSGHKDTESGKARETNNDSEEHLFVGACSGIKHLGAISRTTELEVSYSPSQQ